MKLPGFLLTILCFTLLNTMCKLSIAQSQKTPGDVTLTFRTVTANGNYAPRHVLAVWVEDENGFVKSRLVRANNRKQYLYTWIAASSYNDTDAITGATLNSHQTHIIEWDCTDLDGLEVDDGNYTIYLEFTEKHAQGPLYSIEFLKGDTEQHLTPLDQIYFKDIQLDYFPETTGIELQDQEAGFLNVYPNPSGGIFIIKLFDENTKEISVLTSSGKELLKYDGDYLYQRKELIIDMTEYQNGIYIIKSEALDKIATKKLIKQ